MLQGFRSGGLEPDAIEALVNTDWCCQIRIPFPSELRPHECQRIYTGLNSTFPNRIQLSTFRTLTLQKRIARHNVEKIWSFPQHHEGFGARKPTRENGLSRFKKPTAVNSGCAGRFIACGWFISSSKPFPDSFLRLFFLSLSGGAHS